MDFRVFILQLLLQFRKGSLFERLVFDTTLKDLPPLLLLKTTFNFFSCRKVEESFGGNVLPFLFCHCGIENINKYVSVEENNNTIDIKSIS
jgi:hypothetical protein